MLNNKIKIAYILPMFAVGGAERILFDLIKHLDKGAFDIKLVVIKGAPEKFNLWKKEIEGYGIEIAVIDERARFGRVRKLYETAKYLRKEKFDIVHTQLYLADVIGRIAAKLAGVKIIISTEHNLNLSDGAFKRKLKALTSRLAIKIIAVSEAVKKYAVDFEGADPNKIEVIYNGIEREKFSVPDRSYYREVPVIGAMGRLTRQKGIDYLIKAVSLCEDSISRCFIAGDEDPRENQKASLEKMIIQNGLEEKVKLAGIQKNPIEFYRQIDIFVISSRWEGFPIVLLEAGMAGLPVIAADVGGISEIIKDGQNGYLIKKGDIKGFAEKIQYLAARPEERERLGRKLAETVRAEFDISDIARKYENVYRKLI